ncbi:MAG: metal-sensing transcriptional repressor [Patescibacteria group bacterium]
MTNKICQPEKIIAQLHRIKGQVEAIEKMYHEQRPIEEIVRVMKAARASLDSVAKNLITDKVNGCYRGPNLVKRRELLALIETFFHHT